MSYLRIQLFPSNQNLYIIYIIQITKHQTISDITVVSVEFARIEIHSFGAEQNLSFSKFMLFNQKFTRRNFNWYLPSYVIGIERKCGHTYYLYIVSYNIVWFGLVYGGQNFGDAYLLKTMGKSFHFPGNLHFRFRTTTSKTNKSKSRIQASIMASPNLYMDRFYEKRELDIENGLFITSNLSNFVQSNRVVGSAMMQHFIIHLFFFLFIVDAKQLLFITFFFYVFCR